MNFRPFMVILAALVPAAAEEPSRDGLRLDFALYLEGRHVYERHCVVCHGPRGDGRGEMSAEMWPKPRSFREGWFKFRTTPWDKLPTEDDLRRTITGGLSGTSMGMFTHLRDDEVRAVIEYVKSFSRRWRHPEHHADPLPFPDPPAWLGGGDHPEAELRRASGARLFATHCVSCHGPGGAGDGPAASLLTDAWGQPAKPTDLRQPHLRCGDDVKDVFRILATGLNGTPMLSFDGVLGEAQRWELAAYVVSLRD
jgi:mono/diheme cytochrome c family protein